MTARARITKDDLARACQWCGADISGRRHNARFCDSRCKDKARYEQRTGSPPGAFCDDRKCLICDAHFTALTATRKYCRKECRQIAQREMGREANTAGARRRRAADPARMREAEARRRQNQPERFRLKGRKQYESLKAERPEAYLKMLSKQRERERRRNADRALALLLVPLHQPPKEQARGLPNLADRPGQDDDRGADSGA